MSSSSAQARRARWHRAVLIGALLLLFGVIPAGLLFAAEPAHAVAPDTFWGRVSSQLHLDPKIILAQAIGFLVMFVILWRLVFRRVGGVLDRRRDDIVARMEEIERNQDEAAQLRQQVDERLAGIEQDAQERIAQATRQAVERSAAILEEARASADDELQRARETIERERDDAILSIRAEVADLVVQATTRILGEAIDDARQRQIVDEMIGRLSDEPRE